MSPNPFHLFRLTCIFLTKLLASSYVTITALLSLWSIYSSICFIFFTFFFFKIISQPTNFFQFLFISTLFILSFLPLLPFWPFARQWFPQVCWRSRPENRHGLRTSWRGGWRFPDCRLGKNFQCGRYRTRQVLTILSWCWFQLWATGQ